LRLGILDRDEVKNACPKIDKVQAMTDAATNDVRKNQPNLKPAAFGTAVHWELKNAIKRLGKPEKLRAEVVQKDARRDW
jgi:hypothetical protein